MVKRDKSGEKDRQLRELRRRVRELEGIRSKFEETEKALWESRERCRAAMESAGEGIFEVDVKGTILFANTAGVRKLGQDAEDIVGKTIWEVLPKKAAEAVFEGIPCSIRSQQGHVTEISVPVGDQVRWFQVNVQPLGNPTGRASSALVVATDVTEHRRLLATLGEADRRLRAVMSSAPVSIFAFDSNGIITEAEGRGFADAGYSARQVVGCSVFELCGHLPEVSENVRKALRGEEVSYVVRTSRGPQLHVRYCPVRDDAGNVAYVIGVAMDVTERMKVAEESAIKDKAIESSINGIALTDLDGRLTYVNPSFLRMWGYASDEEVVGRPATSFWTSLEGAQVALEQIQAGKSWTGELVAKRKDGSKFNTHLSVHMVRDAAGQPICLMGSFIDITDRKQAEEKLRASEALFRGVLSSVEGTAIAIVNREGKHIFVAVAPELEAKHGLTAAGILGKTLADYMAPEDVPERAAATEKVFRTGRPLRMETTKHTPVGIAWESISLSPVKDDSGEVTAVVAFVRDITARKLAEHTLKEAKDRLQQIVDNTWDVIFQSDLEGNFTFANKAAERITGYPLEKLLGMNVRDLVAPEDLSYVPERFRRRITGQPVEQPYEFGVIDSHGSRKVLELATTGVYEEDRLVGVQGIARDVTERKKAEAALRESEARFRELVNDLPVGAYRNTPGKRGRFIMANRAMARIHGYDSVEEFLQIDVADLYANPADRESFSKKLISQGLVFQEPVNLRKKDGTTIWGAVTAHAVRDEEGRIQYFDGVLEDITDRMRAETELREAHRKLISAREEERKRLAADLHDSVGQGLIALQLIVGTMRETYIVRHGEDKKAELVLRASKQCDELIQEVRNICHGLYPPTLELGLPTALGQLVRDFQAQTEVRIHSHVSGDVVALPDDVGIALFRIAQECVANAIRHGDAKDISVEVAYAPGQVALEVADDGVGFDPSEVSNRGLGLNMMQERMHAVGGTMEIDSGSGGTRIRARVPLEAGPPSAAGTGPGQQVR